MKVTLYNAISIDGFIATKDGNSDWVSEIDTPYFEAEMKTAGCIVIGRKTFQQFEGQIYPVKDVLNIVMSKTLDSKSKYDNVIFTDKMPKEVIDLAESKGYKSILLVGGGHMNGSFLQAGLIDEIVIDIHPLMLGSGIKMCEGAEVFQSFKMLEMKELEKGLILVRYVKFDN